MEALQEKTDDDFNSNIGPLRNKKKCIFCGCTEKKAGCRRQYPLIGSYDFKMNIKEMQLVIKDEILQQKMTNASDIYYHKFCRHAYEMKYHRLMNSHKNEDELWHQIRKIHDEAFIVLSLLLEEEILKKQIVYLFTDIFRYYKALLIEFAMKQRLDYSFDNFRIDHLQNKILTKYGDVMVIETTEQITHKKIIHKMDMTMDKCLVEKLITTSSEKSKLQDVAYSLRRKIMNDAINKRDKTDSEDSTKDDKSIPDVLETFMHDLVNGPNVRRQLSDEDTNKIKSVCDDIISMINKE